MSNHSIIFAFFLAVRSTALYSRSTVRSRSRSKLAMVIVSFRCSQSWEHYPTEGGLEAGTAGAKLSQNKEQDTCSSNIDIIVLFNIQRVAIETHVRVLLLS